MDLTKNNNETKQDELHSKAWQRLSEWIHCICVVTFDLELGQAMEVRYIDRPMFYDYYQLILERTRNETNENANRINRPFPGNLSVDGGAV